MSTLFQLQASEFDGDDLRHHHKVVNLRGSPSWMAALNEFAEFLGGIYGYDVKDKIIVSVGGEYVPLRQRMVDEALNEVF
ncbi:hypothetical protein [Burkholderia vietnamiensis]|uniref:hypothetical protein n=1 Tax=Burkholderia vietnamiensis TaxID=60552 RepID=UPI002653E279|nr:hypothetical protein [Burkholderia vietnamiensis]MDN8037443.1 hypothetical protein [Burkholderia vietnamiensis]